MEEQIRKRIAEVEQARDALIAEANAKLMAHNTVIAELKKLIGEAPPVDAPKESEVTDGPKP